MNILKKVDGWYSLCRTRDGFFIISNRGPDELKSIQGYIMTVLKQLNYDCVFFSPDRELDAVAEFERRRDMVVV